MQARFRFRRGLEFRRKRCGRDLLTVGREKAGLLGLEAQALHSVLLVGDDLWSER